MLREPERSAFTFPTRRSITWLVFAIVMASTIHELFHDGCQFLESLALEHGKFLVLFRQLFDQHLVDVLLCSRSKMASVHKEEQVLYCGLVIKPILDRRFGCHRLNPVNLALDGVLDVAARKVLIV